MQRLFSLSIFLLIALASQAQKGSVRGKVIDEATGEGIAGAMVRILNTDYATLCDLDGNFILDQIPLAIYDIEASFLGYTTQQVAGAKVVEDGVKLVYFKLQEGSQELGVDVVVTAELEASRHREGALLAQRKKSIRFIETLSAEEIERMGLYNMAQALRLIPNVAIEKERNIYIRGLGNRYVKTLLNGSELPGLDLNSSSIQLDLFPSLVIDNIMIYKTFSSDLIGSFGGGFVDISTKSFPDKFTLQANIAAGFNTAASFNKNFMTYFGGAYDWLGFDDGTRQIPLELEFGELSIPKMQPNQIYDYSLTTAGAVDSMNQLVQAFDLNDPFAWESYQQMPPPNANISFVIGNQSPLKKGVLSYGAVLLYKSSFNYYKNGFTGIYQLDKPIRETFNLRPVLELKEENSTFNVRSNALIHLGYKSKRHRINFTMLQNRDSNKSFIEQSGFYYFWDADTLSWQPDYVSRSWVFENQGLISTQLGGKHLLKRENSFVEWQLSGSRSYILQPDLRYASFAYAYIDSLGSAGYFVGDFIGQTPTRYWRNISAWSADAYLNWTVAAGPKRRAKHRFGLRVNWQLRTFREDQYRYHDTDFFYEGADFYGFFIDQPLQWDTTGGGWAVPGGVMVYEADEPQNNYLAVDVAVAAHWGMEQALDKKERLRLSYGLRLEFPVTLLAFGRFAGLGTVPTFDALHVTPNILPQVSLHYEFQKDMFVRWAYSRTYARPTLREYAAFTSFDFIGDYKMQGNSQLMVTTLDNLDFRWEWFPKPKELLSIGVFGKVMQKPIETASTLYAPNQIFTYRNAPLALTGGVELEFRKQLDFLGEWANDFSWMLNIAYIYSATFIDAEELAIIRQFDPQARATRPLFGQAPYVFNTALSYYDEPTGWAANVNLSLVGNRLAYVMYGATPHIYEQPRPILNVNLSKTFAKYFQIRFFVENVLAQPTRYIQRFQGKVYPYRIQPTAPTFWLSFHYTIK